MSGRGRVGALGATAALLLGVLSGCTDDADPRTSPPAPTQASEAVPGAGYCLSVVDAAGLDGAEVKQIDSDVGATCAVDLAGQQAQLDVRVGELAVEQYETTVGENGSGDRAGFPDAVRSEPTGWWSEGQRLEATQSGSARSYDVVVDGDLVVRLQVVGAYPDQGASTGQDERTAETRRVADALLAAVDDVRGT